MGYGIATAAGIQGGQATFESLLQARYAAAVAAQLHAEKQQQQATENARASRALDIQEHGQQPKPRTDPYVVDGSLVTPQGGVLYTAPPKAQPPQRPITVAPGGSVVDPTTGRIIASMPDRPQKPEHERVVQVMGPNGVPVYVRESEAVGKPAAQAPRAVTGQERQTLGYFNRMLDAEKNARSVEEKVKGSDVAASTYAPGWLENWLKSSEGQQYTQAQRMFTEARLRKESGAAIPENEFANDRKMNFRQPNDAPEAISQKRASRVQTMRGIGNAAGRALQEYYGEGVTLDDLLKGFSDQQPAAAAGAGGGTSRVRVRRKADGQTGTILQSDFDPAKYEQVP